MTGLGPIDRAMLPADVRTASPERQASYKAALQFEQVLVTQLAETMLPKEEGGGFANMLPSALADGIASAGGLGLARSIYDAEGGSR